MGNLLMQSESKGDIVVVTVSGRIDSETAPDFDAELVKATGNSAKLVLELKGVDYMSSAGLRAIVKAAQAVEPKGGSVKLAAAPELVSSVLYTVGLNQKVSEYNSVDEAIASF
ncbi:MAG: STAS domain-containing protein [Anaerolineales bacterium]|nr:STAS domain-containing protein [Anaerolineales bacterium]